MNRFLKSEAGAVVLWVVGSLLLAAALAPWLYEWGKNLAAHVAVNEAAGWIEWLGAACDRAEFGRYFNRALMLSALLLLPFFVKRVRFLKKRAGIATAAPAVIGSRGGQWFAGLLIAGGLLAVLGFSLEAGGAFEDKGREISSGRFLSKAVFPAVATSVIGEWLFRGLLLGAWLRVAGPLTASVGSSLVFAFLHFLEPPSNMVISEPRAWGAGFELLGKIFGHFAEPKFFVTDFLTLFGIGMILAWSRVRTGRLWLAMGLHTGWVVVFKGFNLTHTSVPESALRQWWMVGDSLRSGLLPLVTLVLTASLCHFVIGRFFTPPSRTGN